MDTTRLRKIAEELRQQEELKKSIQMARARQRRMLPKVPNVGGIEFSALYQPAATVSGDFYDFIQVDERLIGIALGDVSGHGVEAAIIMGMAKKALQIYARGRPSPKDALIITNADITRDLDAQTFVSVSYGILDTVQRSIRYARAGHNPPLLLNLQRQPPLREIKPSGMVVGVDKTGTLFSNALFEEVVQLQPGDVFFQYTDGVVEATDRQKLEFGESRLQDLLLRNLHLPLSDLLIHVEEAIQSHIGVQEQADDITMIAFRVEPEQSARTTPPPDAAQT